MGDSTVNAKEMLASRLKLLREENGLSQTKLAGELGVSRGSINYYENYERAASIDFVCKAAYYFDCSADYLLGLSDFRTSGAAHVFNEQISTFSDILTKLPAGDAALIIEAFRNILSGYQEWHEMMGEEYLKALWRIIFVYCEHPGYTQSPQLLYENHYGEDFEEVVHHVWSKMQYERYSVMSDMNSYFEHVSDLFKKAMPAGYKLRKPGDKTFDLSELTIFKSKAQEDTEGHKQSS